MQLLQLILVDIVLYGLSRFRPQVAALYVVQYQDGRPLVFLRQRSESLVQLSQCLLRRLASRAIRVEFLDEPHKLAVDILRIDGTRPRLGDEGVHRIVEVIFASISSFTLLKQFAVTL